MSEEPREVSGEFSAGSVVGGYRLEEQIGQGGMAVVFRAHDARLGRRVALKILAPALARDDAFRQRFIGEWRAAAAVDNRHIIPVFDAGEASGVLFIAMRYVPGGDVRSLLDREGPLPPARVIEIISQAASALDSAHARGLVHDVKPANMLLEESTHSDQPDHVYLSDFGLTKAMSAAVGLTGSGQLVGTVDYLAPEQIEGGPIDGRTDLYALACTAFELLTGVPPFHRYERVAVMYAQVTEPPPALSSQRPGFPAGADAVMARALAKSPADRYQTCREFATALRRALSAAASGSPVAMPEGLRTTPAEPLPTLPRMTGHRAESPAPGPVAGGQPTEAVGYPAASAWPESSPAEMPTETADVPATLARASAAIPPWQASTPGGATPQGGRPGDQASGVARRRRSWWRSPLPVGVICGVAVAASVGGYFIFARGGSSADSGSTALTAPGCTTSLPGLAKSRKVPYQKYKIGGTPFAVLESKDGQYTFVTVGNGIAVPGNRSGTSLEPPHTISVTGVNKGMVTSPAGNYIIAADGSGAVVINRGDAESGSTKLKGMLTSQYGDGAAGIQLSPDGKYLFVTLQNASRRMVVFSYHHAVYHGFGLWDVVNSVVLQGQPVGVAESMDGKWLYVTSYRPFGREPGKGTLSAVSVTEPDSRVATTVKATVNAGCTPASVVADGTTIWVTAHNSNAVLGFSASRLQHGGKDALVADVRVGPAPIGLIVLPDGKRLAIADSNSTSKPSHAGNLAIVSTADALAGKPALLCTIPLAAQPRQMALAQHHTVLLIAEQAPSELQAIKVADLRC